MIDLVERLRLQQRHSDFALWKEAADEIEHLRAERDELLHCNQQYVVEMEQLRAIERRLIEVINRHYKEIDQLRSSIVLALTQPHKGPADSKQVMHDDKPAENG